MKELFVSDLDGTLLGTDSRVSPASASIISRLSRRGALITVATARTPATVEPLLRDVTTTPPAIVFTGAALWDRTGRRYIDPHYFTADSAEAVSGICREAGLHPFTYTIGDDGIIHTYYHGTPDRKERKFIDERSHLPLKRIHIAPLAEPVPDHRPATILIFCLGATDAINRAAALLRESGHCSVSAYPDIFNPAVSYLEIFAPGVSKASAIQRLKTRLGADRVTVFGDNLNDIPMMQAADTAVAVGNALPQVKEIADVVIGRNSTDAVARYLEEFAQDLQ